MTAADQKDPREVQLKRWDKRPFPYTLFAKIEEGVSMNVILKDVDYLNDLYREHFETLKREADKKLRKKDKNAHLTDKMKEDLAKEARNWMRQEFPRCHVTEEYQMRPMWSGHGKYAPRQGLRRDPAPQKALTESEQSAAEGSKEKATAPAAKKAPAPKPGTDEYMRMMAAGKGKKSEADAAAKLAASDAEAARNLKTYLDKCKEKKAQELQEATQHLETHAAVGPAVHEARLAHDAAAKGTGPAPAATAVPPAPSMPPFTDLTDDLAMTPSPSNLDQELIKAAAASEARDRGEAPAGGGVAHQFPKDMDKAATENETQRKKEEEERLRKRAERGVYGSGGQENPEFEAFKRSKLRPPQEDQPPPAGHQSPQAGPSGTAAAPRREHSEQAGQQAGPSSKRASPQREHSEVSDSGFDDDDIIFTGAGAPKRYRKGQQEKSNPVPLMAIPEGGSLEDKIDCILRNQGKLHMNWLSLICCASVATLSALLCREV